MTREDLRYDPVLKSVVRYDGKGLEVETYPVLIENNRGGCIKVSCGGETEFVSIDDIEESALRLARRSI